MSETEIPVLEGYVTRDGVNVAVRCDHCRRWHFHGHHSNGGDCTYGFGGQWDRCICPIGSGDGHRVAHCPDRNSPYDDTGYIIREVGWKDTQ